MNIFYFLYDTNLNAKLLDDKRVVKMIVETTQLLSNALFLNDEMPIYKPTHLKHPCSIWAAKSSGNWLWLKKYGLALANEYTKRYGKIHKCEPMIRNMECPKIKENKFSDPPQCMPDKYRKTRSSRGYINYYINEKFNENYFKHTDKKVYNFWKKLHDKNNKVLL